MHRHRLLLLVFSLLIHAATFSAAVAGCDRRCGGTVVPYPFGFSRDCSILLTCNATISSMPLLPHSTPAAPYPILSFNSTTSTFLAAVAPACNRTVRAAGASLTSSPSHRGTGGYGISYRTGLFLRGGAACRPPPVSYNCSVPADLMTRLLRTQQCPDAADANNTLTCVSALPALAPTEANGSQGHFVPWAMVNASGCEDALTAAVYGDTTLAVVASLQFGVAELGWWLDGACAAGDNKCAANATCQDVETPNKTPGHRCTCRDGMAGDGYADGEGCYRDNAGSKKEKIAVIVAGVLAGVTAITGALFLLCRLQRRRSAAGRYSSAMRLLSEAASSSGVPVYTYHEVSRATDGFSHTHRLGTGAYGTVYVGKLPAAGGGATLVAIKRLRRRHFEDDEDGGHAAAAQLLNEIRLVSSVRHPNLVRLLGCCLDRGEHVLVYEYVPNGTLSHHLHGGEGPHLPWRARLVVAAETAAAIAHLHAVRPAPIFHRDVKSTNILLDADLRPKLADFGLSRAACHVDSSRSHVSTAPQGTPGYVDPEYHQSFHLSDKSDVYSFGVVLLELVTAMKVVDFARPACEVNLASLAVDRIGKGRVAEIVDPAIAAGGEGWVMESVRRVSELAFRCLAFQKDVRPCMSEVAAELAWIRAAAPPGSDSDGPGLRPTTGLQIDTSFDHSLGSTVRKKAASPVSVHETWVSDRSSPPSTNGSAVMPRC